MHTVKVLVRKIANRKDATSDPEYDRVEAAFLDHFHASMQVLGSLESYYQSINKLAAASGDFGEVVCAFYRTTDAAEPRGVENFQKAMTSVDHTTKTLATRELQDQVLTEWTEYCGFLQKLFNKIAERKQLLQDYDYYKSKVRELKEKGPQHESLPRNESKLYAAETAYDTMNRELIEVFTSITNDAKNAFNPHLQKVLACTATVHSESARVTAGFHEIVNSPAGYGCEVKDPKYKPLKLHYGISPVDPAKLKKVVTKPTPALTSSPSFNSSTQSASASRSASLTPKTADADFMGFDSQDTKPVATAKPLGNGKRVRGLYDFEATNEDELSFRTGDIMLVVDETEEGWWTVEKDGKRGVIPNNYVEVI